MANHNLIEYGNGGDFLMILWCLVVSCGAIFILALARILSLGHHFCSKEFATLLLTHKVLTRYFTDRDKSKKYPLVCPRVFIQSSKGQLCLKLQPKILFYGIKVSCISAEGKQHYPDSE